MKQRVRSAHTINDEQREEYVICDEKLVVDEIGSISQTLCVFWRRACLTELDLVQSPCALYDGPVGRAHDEESTCDWGRMGCEFVKQPARRGGALNWTQDMLNFHDL